MYTHLIFAFATVDPETFEVLPSSSYDIDRYKSLNSLKDQDPDLKTYIAIGGWTFSDPGPTATVFSEIARSEVNQKKFIKSLISFLHTYDFDGVDLDWEYPGADDRSGSSDDYANFPVFLSHLHQSLRQTGGRDGISITLPASYCKFSLCRNHNDVMLKSNQSGYLQHFDIKALAKSVTFLNM